MTKVKILQPIMHAGKFVKAGETIEVDNGLAKNLKLRGRAEIVEPARKDADGKDKK